MVAWSVGMLVLLLVSLSAVEMEIMKVACLDCKLSAEKVEKMAIRLVHVLVD